MFRLALCAYSYNGGHGFVLHADTPVLPGCLPWAYDQNSFVLHTDIPVLPCAPPRPYDQNSFVLYTDTPLCRGICMSTAICVQAETAKNEPLSAGIASVLRTDPDLNHNGGCLHRVSRVYLTDYVLIGF